MKSSLEYNENMVKIMNKLTQMINEIYFDVLISFRGKDAMEGILGSLKDGGEM